MTELLREDHPDADLGTWDIGYLETQLRRRDYGVDPDEVRQYFSLEQVVDGMFAITGDVFDLDYRTIDERCDVFVSIGMLEHVGRASYRTLGKLIQRCLKPNGIGLIHTIGRSHPQPADKWIRKRIFPGGHVPSSNRSCNNATCRVAGRSC